MANGFKKNGSQMYRAHAIEAPNKTSFQNAPLKNIPDKTVGLRPAFCALSALLAEVLREGSIFQYFFVFTVGSLELIQGPGHAQLQACWYLSFIICSTPCWKKRGHWHGSKDKSTSLSLEQLQLMDKIDTGKTQPSSNSLQKSSVTSSTRWFVSRSKHCFPLDLCSTPFYSTLNFC